LAFECPIMNSNCCTYKTNCLVPAVRQANNAPAAIPLHFKCLCCRRRNGLGSQLTIDPLTQTHMLCKSKQRQIRNMPGLLFTASLLACMESCALGITPVLKSFELTRVIVSVF
jgi:hypothetical protein